MAWQFQEWKRFAGGGLAAAIVLAVVGMLTIDEPWFRRTGPSYVTMRDSLEIVGGFAERETAIGGSDTNFVPLADAWWHGQFPELVGVPYFGGTRTNYVYGTFTTNAPGVYNDRAFWDGLEVYLGEWFPFPRPEWTTIRSRHWVTTNAAGIAAVAGDFSAANAFDIRAVTNSFLMVDGWWRSNVYDGATYLPPGTNYATHGECAAIYAAMAACRYTLDGRGTAMSPATWHGYARSTNCVAGTPPPGWDYGMEASWETLIAIAYTNMLVSTSDPDWDAVGAISHEIATAWSCVSQESQWWDGDEWIPYTVDVRVCEAWEYVTPCAATVATVGTNVTVTGIGRPAKLAAAWKLFYHGVLGWTEPTNLLTAAATPAAAGGNVRTWFNELLRFDDHPSLALLGEVFALDEDFPPVDGASTGEGAVGTANVGWQQSIGQVGMVCDWTFAHMTAGDEP